MLRQTQFSARKIAICDLALGIVDLIAVRQINKLLGVMGSLINRDHIAIGQHIVVVGSTQRAGESKVVNLNRGTAIGKYAGSGIHRVTTQVHSYIDSHRPGKLRCTSVAMACQVDNLRNRSK